MTTPPVDAHLIKHTRRERTGGSGGGTPASPWAKYTMNRRPLQAGGPGRKPAVPSPGRGFHPAQKGTDPRGPCPVFRYSLLAQIKSLTLLFLKSNLWSAVLPLLRFAAACVSIGSSAPIPARLSAGSIQHDGVRRLPEPFSPPGCGARHWRWAFYFFIGIRQSRTDGRSAPKRCWVTVSTGLTSFSLNFLACGLLGPP